MKKPLIIATAIAAAVMLAGCSSPAAESAPQVQVQSAAPTTSAAPLVASPTAEPEAAASTPESAYLAEIREQLDADTVIPDATDEQLLAAASDACAQMAEGTDFSAVAVIEGEQANDLGVYPDSATIAAVARQTVCP